MLNEKTRQLNQKNKQIEDLYDQIAKLKTENIQRINSLENQIKDAHETTIGKLNTVMPRSLKFIIIGTHPPKATIGAIIAPVTCESSNRTNFGKVLKKGTSLFLSKSRFPT